MVGDPSRPSSPSSPSSPPPPGAPPAAPPGAGGSDAPHRRVLLGELLVESKVITPEQLGEVLSSPRAAGKKLGQVLLERGWITEAQLTQTLSLQLSVPWVSLYHIDFSRQLLNRLPRDVAARYCLIPIFVRHVKGQGETLYVAMDDPTNVAALNEVARLAGLPARPMIASATDIQSAIRVYYGESSPAMVLDVPAPPATLAGPPVSAPGTARGGRSGEAPRSQPPPPPPRRSASVPPPVPTSAPVLGGPDEPAPLTTRSSPPPAGPGSTVPKPRESEPGRPSRRPRMVNLTLLDGTTIQLPAKKNEKTPHVLTAHDFIAALRASASGADATEVLGDQVRWEPIVAALLSILLRKGLVADWEFVEELRRMNGPA